MTNRPAASLQETPLLTLPSHETNHTVALFTGVGGQQEALGMRPKPLWTAGRATPPAGPAGIHPVAAPALHV